MKYTNKVYLHFFSKVKNLVRNDSKEPKRKRAESSHSKSTTWIKLENIKLTDRHQQQLRSENDFLSDDILYALVHIIKQFYKNPPFQIVLSNHGHSIFQKTFDQPRIMPIATAENHYVVR